MLALQCLAEGGEGGKSAARTRADVILSKVKRCLCTCISDTTAPSHNDLHLGSILAAGFSPWKTCNEVIQMQDDQASQGQGLNAPMSCAVSSAAARCAPLLNGWQDI